MGRYAELRQYYRRSYQERAAMIRREALSSIETMRGYLDTIMAAGPERIQQVFGSYAEELIGIAVESLATVERMALRIEQDGQNIADDAQMRDLRHDLRGPVGTLRNATLMVQRRLTAGDDPLAALAVAAVATANDLIDIVEALTEDAERE